MFRQLEPHAGYRILLWPHPTIRSANAPKYCRLAVPHPMLTGELYSDIVGRIHRLLKRHSLTLDGSPEILKAVTTLTPTRL